MALNPIPQNPIGESFVWREWFQRLSDKVFGTLGSQNSNAVAITGGNLSNVVITGGDLNNVYITQSYVNSTPIGLTVPAAARFTSINLDTPLPIASGGTNGVAVPTAGAVSYGTGTAYAFTLAGTTGQVLTSAGASTPTWSTPAAGTVTSVAALTLGTTGTDLSSTVANSTTTPVITLQVPTASATNRGALSSADWSTFNGKLSPFGSQTANYVYAAPNGSAGTPTFRALVTADLPVAALAFATGATYSVLAANYIVKITYSGNVTTLLDATTVTGKIYYLNNASVGSITVDTTSSQTINGVLTQSVPTGSTMQVYSDGSNWWIL
jgi:hypothetical protein